MTTIARQATTLPVVRQPQATIRRAASLAVAVAATVAHVLVHWLDGVGDGGQLGPDYESDVSRWSGGRI